MENGISEHIIPKQDAILQTFVEIANKHDLQIGMTLFFNGQLITGTLISHKQYLEAISHKFKDSDSPIANTMAEIFVMFGKQEIQNKTDEEFPNFIHLKNAKIIDGNDVKFNSNDNPLRIKISDVSAFIFGEKTINN